MTLDYVPAGGGGFVTAHGAQGFTLINNSCVTLGGCGSSAVGIQIGTTNSGTQNGVFSNIKVEGFGTGIQLTSNGTAVPWGIHFINLALAANTTGFNFASTGIENTIFTNPKIAFNATGIAGNLTSSDLYIQGGSIDSNTTFGIHTTGTGILNINQTHFEDLGVWLKALHTLSTQVQALLLLAGSPWMMTTTLGILVLELIALTTTLLSPPLSPT
jgi:hypothetical protein